MKGRKIVLVGESVVDVTRETPVSPTKVRLGGVFHAARAAWAIGAQYNLAYYGPAYLDSEVLKFARSHGVGAVTKIGEISGCPNVMLIADATEAGPQGYEHLLSEHASYTLDAKKLLDLLEDATDVVILAGNFDLAPVLSAVSKSKIRIHVDLGNGPSQFEVTKRAGGRLTTVFLSTSSQVFAPLASGLPTSLEKLAGELAAKVILKENRGGARLFGSKGVLRVGSQRRDIVHSVGVGDVFDVVFVSMAQSQGDREALDYASWVAAEYAVTTFPADFKRGAKRVLGLRPAQLRTLPSVSLPWEKRSQSQIYIAAPDFDYVDRGPIDRLVECLKYHNFSPRLPVRENGQANDKMTAQERRRLYDLDLGLLGACDLVIAVHMFDDPGTLIEIGLAHARGVPVVVYDPWDRVKNIMLEHVPELVSSSLEKVITATFDVIARKCVGR